MVSYVLYERKSCFGCLCLNGRDDRPVPTRYPEAPQTASHLFFDQSALFFTFSKSCSLKHSLVFLVFNSLN